MSLTLYLKWQLEEPLKLATHGYETPYDALRDKTQSILTQIVAHRMKSPTQARGCSNLFCLVDYSSMVKQRSIGGDGLEEGESSSQFLDALRTHAMDDLHTAALEYGIILKDLAVIDRQFKGETLLRRFRDQLLTNLRRDRQHNGQAYQARFASPGGGCCTSSARNPYDGTLSEPHRMSTGKTATRSSKKRVSSLSPASRPKLVTCVPALDTTSLTELTSPHLFFAGGV